MNEDKRNNFKIAIFIAILSTIPLFFIWGKLAIGGDTMIPTNSASLEKYLFQWMGTQNGQYFSINYYPLYVFYKFFELFHPDVYLLSSVLTFLLNFFAGYGVYRLVRLFSVRDTLLLYIVPVLFYLFSPALLNGWHYLYIYSAAPWFFYFIFKWIKSGRIEVVDILWINVIIFFSSLDLPNPKYLFHLFLIALIVIGLSVVLKLIKWDFFVKNALKFVILAISFTYLMLPLLYFATHYTPEAYGVYIKKGYKDVGSLPDYGSATVDKMFRLHHNGLNLNVDEKRSYLSNTVVSVLSYLFIIIIIVGFLFRKRFPEESRYLTICLAVILVGLFFASGPNPPFGSIYESFVEKFSFLAFLRTTAGAVFFLSIFYALALFIFLQSVSVAYQKVVASILVASIFIVGYPLFNGEFYQNNTATSQYVKKDDRGIKVPDAYFKMKEVLDKKQLDARVLVPNIDSSYISLDWGYFGPPLYYFIFRNSIVTFDKVYSSISLHNVGLVLFDYSTVSAKKGEYQRRIDGLKEIAKKEFLSIAEVSQNIFLPHFYIPKKVIFSRKNTDQLPQIVSANDSQPSLAVFFDTQMKDNGALINTITNQSAGKSSLEFKKINPTKYRIRIHKATGMFPLVFSEGFHTDWKMYLVNRYVSQMEKDFIIARYKVLDGNETEQASREDLIQYIGMGKVSTLGNGREKQIKHQKWVNNRLVPDYAEQYNIAFVSRDFQGTIQNDNLPNGKFWETWFKKPFDNNTNHVIANGYANAWVIDIEKTCSENSGSCQKNSDGTYDIETVVEFWPQRLFSLSWFVSGTVLLFCIGQGIFQYKQYKKEGKGM